MKRKEGKEVGDRMAEHVRGVIQAVFVPAKILCRYTVEALKKSPMLVRDPGEADVSS